MTGEDAIERAAMHATGTAALDAARDFWAALANVAPDDELRRRCADLGPLLEAWIAKRAALLAPDRPPRTTRRG